MQLFNIWSNVQHPGVTVQDYDVTNFSFQTTSFFIFFNSNLGYMTRISGFYFDPLNQGHKIIRNSTYEVPNPNNTYQLVAWEEKIQSNSIKLVHCQIYYWSNKGFDVTQQTLAILY